MRVNLWRGWVATSISWQGGISNASAEGVALSRESGQFHPNLMQNPFDWPDWWDMFHWLLSAVFVFALGQSHWTVGESVLLSGPGKPLN
jgi:hypothetical protein